MSDKPGKSLVTLWSPWPIVALWALMSAASFAWNLVAHSHHVDHLALETGRSIFSLIETTRLWNAKHGGVYVPVTKETQPNPYLETDRRDLQVGDLKLTLVNPAYMTRQIAELAVKEQGILFHITSLRPIRPDNMADAWETGALKAFEEGTRQVIERVEGNGSGDDVYRFMAPLITKEACLACHASQGYRLGDIRGGISVTMPAKPFIATNDTYYMTLGASHVLAFFLLSGVTVYFFRRLQRRAFELEAVKDNQEKLIEARTRELELQKAELEKLNGELQTFSYGASHDLKEPLRMVSGYISLIRHRYGDKLDAEGLEFLEFAEDGAQRMNGIVCNLLDYSRVQRMGHAIVPVDSRSAWDQAVATQQLRLDGIGARIDAPAVMPTVMADEDQLVRVMVNLLGNAIKYRKRDVPLHCELSVDTSTEKGVALFSLTDNGVGLPPDHLDDLFMIFYRIDPIGDTESKGTGIGLALCRRIIERFGGRIWADNRPEGGAVFQFTVPMADVHDETHADH